MPSFRASSRGYNESVGGVNNDTQGYHDTITRAYLRGVRLFLEEADVSRPIHELVNELLMTRRWAAATGRCASGRRIG